MDKYLVHVNPSREVSKPIRRTIYRWKRSLIELTGRIELSYRRYLTSLLLQSFSEIRAFPHCYDVNGFPCTTHLNLVNPFPLCSYGIGALEFDNKGVYLASLTKKGCLTVHDFESLCCQANDSLLGLDEDKSKHVLHLSLHKEFGTVRWNPANQDEVGCTSLRSNEVLIFDIGYICSDPVEVLKTRRSVTVLGSDLHKGLTDMYFTTTAQSSVIASDTHGFINVWDRRMSVLPCLELTTNSRSILNSFQLNVDNQMVFGSGRHGVIYMWDLRGGSAAASFHSHKEACHPPVSSWKLSSMLEKIVSLKAQSDIVSQEVHSINFDPSCPYQLAFHLDDGWSGVFDIYNFKVTHVHCPPPAWLNGSDSPGVLYVRKPSWLPTHSVYVVGSSADNGIHLLDFYPDPSSPCHVDYSDDAETHTGVNHQKKQNRFVALSERVTACATHPLNGTIVAGTEAASLVVVSQRKESFRSGVDV